MKRIEYGEVELAPDFQRRVRIWDLGRKSRLIESILLRIPLPVFYVAADIEENWRVVDGLQRLTTIFDFTHTTSEHSFNLRGMEYLQAYEGANFLQLPRSIKRRIEETELNINVIESGTPDEVMFNVFKRINAGGISLNGQEIHHALNPGPARDFLLNLATSTSFRSGTDGSVKDERMAARELALRFSAFWLTPPENYVGSDLDGFLNEAMKNLNQKSLKDLRQVEAAFDSAMSRAREIFGDDAFPKRLDQYASRSPINRALFEAWSVNLARLSDGEFDVLKDHSSHLRNAFYNKLSASPYFLASISVATGSRARLVERFSTIQDLIEGVIR